MKYNRNKNILTTDLQIPDYDFEAGIKLAVTDSSAKGKKMRGITVDVTNKDIPQLSLVGHARYGINSYLKKILFSKHSLVGKKCRNNAIPSAL